MGKLASRKQTIENVAETGLDSRSPTETWIDTDKFFKGKLSEFSLKIRLLEFRDRIEQEIDHLS